MTEKNEYFVASNLKKIDGVVVGKVENVDMKDASHAYTIEFKFDDFPFTALEIHKDVNFMTYNIRMVITFQNKNKKRELDVLKQLNEYNSKAFGLKVNLVDINKDTIDISFNIEGSAINTIKADLITKETLENLIASPIYLNAKYNYM